MKTASENGPYREAFNQVLIFRSLSPEAQTALFDRATFLCFEGGEKIITYGDLSPSFFAVISGSVHVTMKQDGVDVYIDTLGEGSVFGEAAMFLKTARTADVASADDSVICKLTRYDLIEFLNTHPREGNKLLLAMVYELLIKLKSSNQELVFERRSDSGQSDVDALIAELADK